MVNCRVKNECDPALALLADYVQDKTYCLQIGAVLGLGLAYVGTARNDVIELIIPALESASGAEQIAICSLSLGLVSLGTCNAEVSSAILTKLVDLRESDTLKSSHMNLTVLGLGLCYLGRKECTEATAEALEVFEEPFSSISKIILNMCAYAGTGDVFMVQELLVNCGEKITMAEPATAVKEEVKPKAADATAKTETEKKEKDKEKDKEKKKSKVEWEPAMAQAVAVLGLGIIEISLFSDILFRRKETIRISKFI